jgi:Icc-related predicted phosphoesterase
LPEGCGSREGELRHPERSVVVHHAPVAATLEGEPNEILPFLGSSRLAETIDRFGVSAILHGQAHHGTYEARTEKGIPVYNCARSVPKPTGRPYALIWL